MAAKKHSVIIGGRGKMGMALTKLFSSENHICSVIGRRTSPHNGKMEHSADYWSVDLLNQNKLSDTLRDIVRKNGKINNLIFFQRYRDQMDHWLGEIGVSLTATKVIIESLANHFDRQGGSIVLVSSINAEFINKNLPIGYHVAKAGLCQMSRYYAVVLGSKGIRVNAVLPATVLKNKLKEFYRKNKKFFELNKKITPMGRMVAAEDIAHLISFLCSARGAMITGQSLVVDGGLSLLWQESLAAELTLRE